MPTIGKTTGEVNALEDIADQIASLVNAKREKEKEVIFTIHRDENGDIATVTCKPNGTD
jgi:hypothetical protein